MAAGDDVRVVRCRALLAVKGAVTRAELGHALDDPIPQAADPMEPAPPPETPDMGQPLPERPGPGNTGVPAGVKLIWSGSVTTQRDGQVIDGLDVLGMVKVQHDNVTIRRSRIKAKAEAAPSDYPIKIASGVVGTVVEDVEIDGSGRTTVGIAFKNFTARRVNIHDTGDGVRADGDTALLDSWVHDLARITADAHGDCVQILKGAHVQVLRNTLDAGTLNSAFIISAQAPVDDVLIEGNVVMGGGWTVYLGGNTKGIPVTGVRLVDNVFGPSKHGRIHPAARGAAVLAGNVDAQGAPVG